MRLNFSFFVLILLSACLKVEYLHAQEGQPQTIDLRSYWKGLDVDTILNNSKYATQGKKFYLYNVGTGRFIIEGGNWGMEGRLFHEDFGRPLYLLSDGYINSGITEETNGYKHVFGCNVPGVSKKSARWIRDYDKYSFTVLMDVYQKDLAKWQFLPVETSDGTNTYYIYEYMDHMPTMTNVAGERYEADGSGKTNYYLGAAYGECHVTQQDNQDGKGDGKLVFLDDDRSCWTTANVIGNNETHTVNGEQVTIDELYQWRLISEDEFIKILNDVIIKINPSVSSLIPDRDFCRNSEVFDDSWVMEGNTTGTGRYGYTWGLYYNNTRQEQYYDEAWDRPLRLKGQFGDPSKGKGMKNSKYGFLSFEGKGRTYTEFEVPRQGWYEVQCYGFVMSDSDHDAYLFAKVKGSDLTTSYGGESKNSLSKVAPNNFPYSNGEIGAYPNKHTEDGFLEVGKVLTKNGERFKSTVWICVTAEQFNDKDNPMKILQIGIGKDEATQSSATSHSGKDYYYDTDWVCVDDFRATYMGEAPVFFYEDEESLDYLNLSGEPQQHNQAFINPDETGHYSGAVCLERTFKKDAEGNYQWHSFSFPLPLTGVQMREAFGDGAVLAKINSIGKMSLNPNVIDFETVSLKTTDTVVEPGQFYLLKPAADPVKGIDSRGNFAVFFQMGRMFFSINETEDPEVYKFPILDLNKWNVGSQEITGYQNENSGIASVNYVQTAGYNTFQVNSDGFYTGSENNIFAPNGAYVVSNNTIYHINKDTRLKGFRGWITLDHPIPTSEELSMAVYGKFNNEGTETIIGELPTIHTQLPSNTAVYDLSGRRVGTIGMNLSKGLYIVNGKKFFVK